MEHTCVSCWRLPASPDTVRFVYTDKHLTDPGHWLSRPNITNSHSILYVIVVTKHIAKEYKETNCDFIKANFSLRHQPWTHEIYESLKRSQ